MEPRDDEFGLFQIKPEDYGPKYREDLFEQYKMYVEMADRISERRATANNFFLTANALLISIFGIVVGKDAAISTESMGMWFPLFALSGIAFSITWFYIVKSYRQLNLRKFTMIHKIEKHLPLALYTAESIAFGKGRAPNRYRSLTDVEKYAPITFGLIYAIILFAGIYLSHVKL